MAELMLHGSWITSSRIKGDQTLFFDEDNWQALCFHCHNSRKQRAERTGYDATPGVDGMPTDSLTILGSSRAEGDG